jgi:hypothetical protein
MDNIINFFINLYQTGRAAATTTPRGDMAVNLNQMISTQIDKVTKNILDVITNMPLISSLNEMKIIYWVVLGISVSCISCIFAYKGIKLLFSLDEMNRSEGKRIFSRLIYSLILEMLSLKYIDALIIFNNLIMGFMISKTNNLSIASVMNDEYGFFLPLILLLIELGILVKILIGFWMRMAELVFAAIVSPVMFTLWINNEWSGFLRNWNRRVIVLTFTQSAQVLLLIIYTLMLNGWTKYGTFNSICLTVAALFSIDRAPKILQVFSGDSSYDQVKSTVQKAWKSKPVRMITHRK